MSRPRLADEARLIRAAETSLERSDVRTALRLLDEHARSFPNGALSIERWSVRVIALCRAGNLAQGRGEAALLLRDPASKPYRVRISAACEDDR